MVVYFPDIIGRGNGGRGIGLFSAVGYQLSASIIFDCRQPRAEVY